MPIWSVHFQENGEEYEGSIDITCDFLQRDLSNERVVFADHVKIEIDEKIVYVEVLTENGWQIVR